MGAGSRGLILLGFLAFFDSCVLEGQSCTAIGCGDGASMTLRRADRTLPPGTYTLRFTVSDRTHVCTFRMPEDLPTQPGQVGSTDCDPPFNVSVMPEVKCMETRTGNAVSQSCTPVPDQWYFSAVFEGTPPDAAVVVERDGVELLNEQHTLVYRDTYPNGPDCGPACRQASAELTLSD